jgi:hypothetical protein
VRPTIDRDCGRLVDVSLVGLAPDLDDERPRLVVKLGTFFGDNAGRAAICSAASKSSFFADSRE